MKKPVTLSLLTLGICTAFSLSGNAQLLSEGFESASFPPSGWTVNNPDGATTWSSYPVGKTGTKSATTNGYNTLEPEKGQRDDLITKAINLTGASSPAALTFQVAYKMWSNPLTYATSDTLSVYISTNSGISWNLLYQKAHLSLVTTAPNTCDSVNQFVPTNNQWRLETLPLTSYATATSAQFKFESIYDWEQNLYIDDILINGSGTGVNEVNSDADVSVFPNPSHGEFTVYGLQFATYNLEVYNIVGELVVEKTVNHKQETINLNQPNGIYFVKVKTENGNFTKKLILNK